MSVMFNDLLTTYKFGWKTSYYHNTYDAKGEDEDEIVAATEAAKPPASAAKEDEACEACTI